MIEEDIGRNEARNIGGTRYHIGICRRPLKDFIYILETSAL